MAKRENRNKTDDVGGRPRAYIDKEAFEALCRIQATKEEITSVLMVDEKTLTKWCKETYDGLGFSEVYPKKASGGRASLRRTQMAVAQSGNPTMLIWLGKQYLDQKDKQENTGDMNLNVKVEWK